MYCYSNFVPKLYILMEVRHWQFFKFYTWSTINLQFSGIGRVMTVTYTCILSHNFRCNSFQMQLSRTRVCVCVCGSSTVVVSMKWRHCRLVCVKQTVEQFCIAWGTLCCCFHTPQFNASLKQWTIPWAHWWMIVCGGNMLHAHLRTLQTAL